MVRNKRSPWNQSWEREGLWLEGFEPGMKKWRSYGWWEWSL